MADRLTFRDGALDELVMHHPSLVHVEALGEGTWWIGIYAADGSRVTMHVLDAVMVETEGMPPGDSVETAQIPEPVHDEPVTEQN